MLRLTQSEADTLTGKRLTASAFYGPAKSKRRKLTVPERAHLSRQGGAWVLDISDATPSANQILSLHWRVQRKIKDGWATLVRTAVIAAQERPEAARGRRLVLIERWSRRALDHDNFVAGCKGPMDCLREVGLIEDDRPSLVSVEYRQLHGEPRSRITVRVPG